MTSPQKDRFPTEPGYMTRRSQRQYIRQSIKAGKLPPGSDDKADFISLIASSDPQIPIQFWQLFSVLGPDAIVGIVTQFYTRVFADEVWFASVFERIGPLNHHVITQASMWADVMGGGPYYHGADFRLNFHHHHNAMQLMNQKGAQRWVMLMENTLDASPELRDGDPRLRPSINTFLTFFMKKYALDFGFSVEDYFTPTILSDSK